MTKLWDEQHRRADWDGVKNFPVDDWKHQVANDETRLSYRRWVEQKVRSAAADLSDKYPDAPNTVVYRDALSGGPPGLHTPTLRERLVSYGVLWPLIMIGLPVAVALWVVAVRIVF